MSTTGSVAPISNELAEQLIIGQILVNSEAREVLPTLPPQAFTNRACRKIYYTALMLQCQNVAPTIEAVSAWLRGLNLLSDEMKAALQKCQSVACHHLSQNPPPFDGDTLLPAVRLVMTKYLRERS